MKKTGTKWNDKEVDVLLKLLKEGKTPKEISVFLKRTEKGIRLKAERLGISFKDYKVRNNSDYISDFVLCPFFESLEYPRKISCEGFFDGTDNYLIFKDKELFCSHINSCCNKNWENCLIAATLIKKYAEASDE